MWCFSDGGCLHVLTGGLSTCGSLFCCGISWDSITSPRLGLVSITPPFLVLVVGVLYFVQSSFGNEQHVHVHVVYKAYDTAKEEDIAGFLED